MAQRNITLRGFRVDIDAYHVSRPSITGAKNGVDVLLDVAIDDAASGGAVTLVPRGDRWIPYGTPEQWAEADLLQWLCARVRDDEDRIAVLDVIAGAAAAAVDETRSPRADDDYDDDDYDDDDYADDDYADDD